MKTDRWPNVLTDFIVATSLLTRLPLPHLPDQAFERTARAVWAYPLAGALVGGLAALGGYCLLIAGLPAPIAAGLVLAILMIATGAMHEDGLADVADGFWGGHTPERRLDIMKDSQIGTYGTLALIVATGLRWIAYTLVLQNDLIAVVAVAALSRSGIPALMWAMPHARNNGLSHSVGRPSKSSVVTASLIGFFVALVATGWTALALVVGVCLVTAFIGWLARKKIGGQTGDLLGATQQISEVVILLLFLAVK